MDYPGLLKRLAREPELATLLLNFIMPTLKLPRHPKYRQKGAIVPAMPWTGFDVALGEVPLVLAVMPGDISTAEVICGEKLIWRTETSKDDGSELIGFSASVPRASISVGPGGQALSVRFIEARGR